VNADTADLAPGTVADRPRTVRDLLFTPGGETPADLGPRIWAADADRKLERVLGALPRGGRVAVIQATGAQAARLLGLDLASLLVAGWRAQPDLAAAACRTQACAAVEVVALSPHEVTATQQPWLTVLSDRQPIAVFRLGLRVRLEVRELVAEVAGGRLARVHAGHAVGEVTLTCHGQVVAEQTRPFAVPGLVPDRVSLRRRPPSGTRLSAGSRPGGPPTASTAAGSPADPRTVPIGG
jgi:hypothetical protein